jgi:hypothetical protein
VLLRPEGVLNDGVYNGFFGVTLQTGFEPELFFGKPGESAVGQYVVEDRGSQPNQVSSGVNAVVGETAFLVLKAEFGAAGGNDRFTLYANPTPGGAEPAGGAVKTSSNIGTVTGLTLYSTGAFSFDEIRVGTTFADVAPGGAPVVPLPSAAWGGLALIAALGVARKGRSAAATLGRLFPIAPDPQRSC